MATLDEIRAAEAELLPTLASLRARVEQQNQDILDLIARGNITPAEAEAINQRAAQTNQQIAAAQPLLRRTLALVDEGAGFLNRPAVNEIGTRIRDTVSSFSALAGQAGANRQEMNRLATADQAATKEATDDKASTDQGPKTDSAAVEASTDPAQNPPPDTPRPPTNTNAQPSGATAPAADGVVVPPVLPGTSTANVTPTVQGGTATAAAASIAVNALQTPEIGTTVSSYIYKATAVTSRFSRGQFTQELEGVLLLFPEDVVEREAVFRGTQTEGDAGEVEARANLARTTAAPTPAPATDQTQVETNRLAQAGRTAAGAVQGLPTATLQGTGISVAPPVNVIPGALGSGLNPQQAVGAILPATSRAATSLGQVVGLNPAGRGTLGTGISVKSPPVPVTLANGQTATVNSVDQVQALFNQGSIDNAGRERALTQIAALTAAQTATGAVARQSVRKDN